MSVDIALLASMAYGLIRGIRQGRRVQPFMAVELPAELPAEQAEPVVKIYVDRYGRRYGGFVAQEFEQMPDPNDHPVFRLDLQERKNVSSAS